MYIEYNHTIRKCVNTSVLDLFTYFMLKGKSLLDYTNIFSPIIMRRKVK